jgi:hypothetical protein
MKKFKFMILAIAGFACSAATIQAADFKIVANSSIGVSDVSSDELKGVFLGTKTSLGDGSHATPVLEKSGRPTKLF